MKHLFILAVALTASTPAAAEEPSPIRAAEARADRLFERLAQSEDDFAGLARAQSAFARGAALPCAGSEPRIAMLDAEPDGSRTAYLLSVAPKANTLYLGGHYRVTFAADGTPGEVELLAAGCETISWDADDPELEYRVAYFQRPGAAGPNEIDLLLSRQLPFAVGLVAPPQVWPLLGGRADAPLEADAAMLGTE